MAGGTTQTTTSEVPAILFTVLFGLATLLHLYQLGATRTWFWLPFLVGGIFETCGFGARSAIAEDPSLASRKNSSGKSANITAANIISNVGIILAPVLFAASLYMTVARIVRLAKGEQFSIVSPRWMTRIFVTSDIITFFIQLIGVSMLLSADPSKISTGKSVILLGLWVQVVVFGFFIVNALLFWHRMRKAEYGVGVGLKTPWVRHLIMLLVASCIILVRCIYRVVEYMQGVDGDIATHEVYMYLLDSGPIVIMMVLLNLVHPSEIGGLLYGKKMVVKVIFTEDPSLNYEDGNQLNWGPQNEASGAHQHHPLDSVDYGRR